MFALFEEIIVVCYVCAIQRNYRCIFDYINKSV